MTVIMDKQMSPDLLSNLPTGIIDTILSFVPVRDAIRTSILSRKWRSVWSNLPYLTFDDQLAIQNLQKIGVRDYEKRLIDFITHTLFLHQGHIHTFNLLMLSLSMKDDHCIDQWLLFLSRTHIKNLFLQFAEINVGVEIRTSLYSCQSLTNLKLHVHTIRPPLPSFKGFPFLRSLDVCLGKVDSSTIERIVALSPLLENLVLDGNPLSEITVRAPNLKYFHLKSGSAHLFLCAPLLEELIVDFSPTKYFSIGDQCLFFRHLRTIKLSSVPFDIEKVRIAVFRLIMGSPCLQKLEISRSCSWKSEASKLALASFRDTEFEPDYTFDSLKVIKMEIYGLGINLMILIKFLLARSPALEKMMYEPLWYTGGLETVMEQLLKCPRASANAEIVIVDPPVSVSKSLQLQSGCHCRSPSFSFKTIAAPER